MIAGEVLGGRYRLGERLGRGGMAEVFRGEDLVLGRPVAVKVLTAHLVGDPKEVRRLHREARALAALNHPNVVAVHDAVTDGDVVAIVMELVEGRTLAQLLAVEGPLAVDRAVALTRQIADGLQAAHARGVVHRDVKPANVLVTADGLAKVVDFGIAGTMAAGTATATVRGSVPYLAPEQAAGGPPDPRSDVYALGCLLFEALTGGPPFRGTMAEVVGQHLHAAPPRVADLRPDVPARLDALVARALAKDPSGRFADLTEFRAGLTAAPMDPSGGAPPLDRTAVLTPPALPATRRLDADAARTRPPDRRRWWPAGVAAIAVVAMLGLLATLQPGPDGPGDQPSPTVPGAPNGPEEATSPSPTASPTPDSAEELVRQLRQALVEGREDGRLSGEAVGKLEDRLRDLSKELARADDDRREKVVDQVDKLDEEITTLVQDRELSEGFAEELRAQVHRLRAQV